jgi:sphingosine kinase
LRTMPLAIIAGGTGNGLCASVLHHSAEGMAPVNSAFLVVKARPLPADLSLVETQAGRRLSFLSLNWGLLADVDIKSEVLRSLGGLRMDVFGVYSILRLKRYRGRLSFLPWPEPNAAGAAACNAGAMALPSLPPLDEPAPSHWVSIEADFLMVLISHVSHIAEKVHCCPGKALSDGTLQIVVVRRPVSRLHLMSLFLSIERGGHIHSEAVEVFRCTAYRIEPLTAEGLYSLDGEEVPEYGGSIQGVVMPQSLRLLGALT